MKNDAHITVVLLVSCLCMAGCWNIEEPEQVGEEPEDEVRQIKPEVVVDCNARSLASCERDDECVHFYGKRLDVEGMCWSEYMPALCKPRERFVSHAVTYAASPSGECWRFANQFLPDGWRPLGAPELYEELYGEPYPSCPEWNEVYGLDFCE